MYVFIIIYIYIHVQFNDVPLTTEFVIFDRQIHNYMNKMKSRNLKMKFNDCLLVDFV